jgi:hypothetical protein
MESTKYFCKTCGGSRLLSLCWVDANAGNRVRWATEITPMHYCEDCKVRTDDIDYEVDSEWRDSQALRVGVALRLGKK